MYKYKRMAVVASLVAATALGSAGLAAADPGNSSAGGSSTGDPSLATSIQGLITNLVGSLPTHCPSYLPPPPPGSAWICSLPNWWAFFNSVN